MQTRADFLAHGLSPVPNTTLSALANEDLDCTICTEALSDPVQLPCSHIFDKACIIHWLDMPGKNTCPFCRRELFSMPFAEPTNPVADRQQLVYRAVREAGLAVDQPRNIQLFGIPRPSWSDESRATPAAAQYLIFSSAPHQQDVGPALINLRLLAAHVVAMGNLLPVLAALQGRPYDQRQRVEWAVIIYDLFLILVHRGGVSFDALVLPRLLRSALEASLQRVEGIDFFNADSPASADLDTMMSYVTHVSFQHSVDRDRARQQAARAGTAAQRRRGSGGDSKQRCAMM